MTIDTSHCPPLPVITQNRAVKADYEASDAHFVCVREAKQGGRMTPADWNSAVQQSRNWIYAQLAKYAVVTPEGKVTMDKILSDNAASGTPIGITTPRIISTPAPATTAAPGRAIDNALKSSPTPVQPIGATPMKTASLGSLVGTAIPGVGTLGGGLIGAGIDALTGGMGKSKCPGPYNYNPTTGGCDPKPGSLAGTTCPDGTTYDPSTGQCKVGGISGAVQRTLPGGQTGYVDPTGWAPTQAYGLQGVIPQAIPSQRLACPAGYVLYGKQPGMEVCLPKGFLPNKHRKWPKAPRPALTSQDMRTLGKINTLQRRIASAAQKAGFKKPVKR